MRRARQAGIAAASTVTSDADAVGGQDRPRRDDQGLTGQVEADQAAKIAWSAFASSSPKPRPMVDPSRPTTEGLERHRG